MHPLGAQDDVQVLEGPLGSDGALGSVLVPSGSDGTLGSHGHGLVAKFATNASGAVCWPNLQLMQVVPSCGQVCNSCKWRHLVANFATNANGAIWWSNLQLMQVAPSC